MVKSPVAYKEKPEQRNMRITHDKPEVGVSADAIRFEVAHPNPLYLAAIANEAQFMGIIRGYQISRFIEIEEHPDSFVLRVEIPRRKGLALGLYRHLSDYFTVVPDQSVSSAESNHPAVIYIDRPIRFDTDFVAWTKSLKGYRSVKIKDEKMYRWTYTPDKSTIHLWTNLEEDMDHTKMMKMWEKDYANPIEDNDVPKENPHLAIISVKRNRRGNLIPAKSCVYILSKSLTEEGIRDLISDVYGLLDSDRDALEIGSPSLRFEFVYKF